MAKEIEYKYELKKKPAGLVDGVEISQGYLSTGNPEVRVRAIGGKYYLTRKGGEGFIRSEEEQEISEEIFGILWPLTAGKRMEKIRYKVTDEDGHPWEVDVYKGHLSGMFTAEKEVPDASVQPAMPSAIAEVFLADRTNDKRFKNKALAEAAGPPTRE